MDFRLGFIVFRPVTIDDREHSCEDVTVIFYSNSPPRHSMEDSDTGSQNQRASEIIDGGVLDADGGATELDGGQLGGGGQVAEFRNWTLTKLGHAVEAGIRTPNPSLDTRYKEELTFKHQLKT